MNISLKLLLKKSIVCHKLRRELKLLEKSIITINSLPSKSRPPNIPYLLFNQSFTLIKVIIYLIRSCQFSKKAHHAPELCLLWWKCTYTFLKRFSQELTEILCAMRKVYYLKSGKLWKWLYFNILKKTSSEQSNMR